MSCSWAFTVFITLASFTGLGVANSIRDAHLDFKRENASIPTFYLNIYNPKIQTFAPEFLTSSGSVTPSTETANVFKLTNYGGLATADEDFVTLYLSTSGDQPSAPWQMSPSLFSIYTGFNLTTTDHGEVLTWKNKAFDRGKARFCQAGSQVTILYKGDKPRNCNAVDLLAYRIK